MNNNRKVSEFEKPLKTKEEKRNFGASESAGNKGSSGSNTRWSIALPKKTNIDEKRRKERAENLVQLICWGPN